jgi:HSP20 family protein
MMNELAPFMAWRPFDDQEAYAKLPVFRTTEEPERYVVTAELPGFKPEEVKVGVVGDQITIEGKHEQKGEENKKTYRRIETFERRFTLPADVRGEGIEAVMEHGLLELMLPKVAIARPKEIPVVETREPTAAQAPPAPAEPVKVEITPETVA